MTDLLTLVACMQLSEPKRYEDIELLCDYAGLKEELEKCYCMERDLVVTEAEMSLGVIIDAENARVDYDGEIYYMLACAQTTGREWTSDHASGTIVEYVAPARDEGGDGYKIFWHVLYNGNHDAMISEELYDVDIYNVVKM